MDGHSPSITDIAYHQPEAEGLKDGRPQTVTYIPETVVYGATLHQCRWCPAICHAGVPSTAVPCYPITDSLHEDSSHTDKNVAAYNQSLPHVDRYTKSQSH